MTLKIKTILNDLDTLHTRIASTHMTSLQQLNAIEIIESIAAAWRNGEFGTSPAGILGAPTFVQKAVVLLGELNSTRIKRIKS